MTNDPGDGTTVVKRREDIPGFTSEAEEAAFWSTHEIAERLFTRRGPRPGSLAEKLSQQRFEPYAVYSRDADVAYVYLQWGRRKRTKRLDGDRLIDLAADGTPLGVQFLHASEGVDLRDVPEPESVAELLKDLELAILAWGSRREDG